MRCARLKPLLSFAVVGILLSPLAFGQSQKTAVSGAMDQVLYGASYYHEYMPYERLDKDVALMQQAGLNVVRMGESTWSLWEPADGHFEYAWMDRVVDAMGKAGIKVIMGTPTYSIPTWLYHRIRKCWPGRWVAASRSTACVRTWIRTTRPTGFMRTMIRNLVNTTKTIPR